MNTPEIFTQKEKSIIEVLSRGSGKEPTDLDSIRKHLSEIDPHAWKIILGELKIGTREDVVRILETSIQVQGVTWTVHELIRILLLLPDPKNTIRDKLNQIASETSSL